MRALLARQREILVSEHANANEVFVAIDLEDLVDQEASGAIRAIFYELGIERLGRDDPETVRLTGVYHNLIRVWAEV